MIYNPAKARSDGILRPWFSIDPRTPSFPGLVGRLSCSQGASSTPPSAQIIAESMALKVEKVLGALTFPSLF